ncbi:asparagine synthase (glutamine-hydrolyzing) [Candidatus Kaiserbacteria bacterium RIFCSPHIGHO2_01_FULL_48_10]|uniref:asparagine synthase (glutamine-hydrolyzing) n=1 Tax=Candidatus Kaiserbacteria bacterium RIFCSPHIGHO2_01_FULL_48_10 TaxID=1798476 RepID=A0A1F6C1N6_9BACT|nr:MAG: asparagine synthase (glutamine-hydrolyzing) [Candidatus Kaiserbacteria bacterium RIFCSPHIGHO2_01_FULL_48_10]
MCGILGFVGNDEALAEKMAQRMSHRGPDGAGVFADEHVTLGHRRLAVIDLSPGAAQPMWSPDKTLGIIFNGEIYNFKELRKNLEDAGEHFVTDSDTEVILVGFKKEGKAFFSTMRGMWALALYDREKKTVTLARDPFGIKPLYYLEHEGHFAFASEMKALNCFAQEKKIRFTFSPVGCASFFTLGYAVHPHTVFNEIKKLPPNTIATYQLSSRKLFLEHMAPQKVTVPDTLEDALKDSVKHHLVADVPVGVFLSGGVDSTLIALMLKELGTPLHAFTVSMEGREDAMYAAKVAAFSGLTHHVIPLSSERLERAYKTLFDSLDEPVADPGILPSLVVSEEARKHVTCVLTGEGGDELFFGYERYKTLRTLSRVDQSLGFFESLSVPFFSSSLKALARCLRLFEATLRGDLLEGYLEMVSLSGDLADRRLLSRELRGRFAGRSRPVSFFDETLYLPDDLLYKTDIATMAHSLEARTPFLDPMVAFFARGIPLKEKWHTEGKRPLRELLAKRLPPEMRMPGKSGFGVPRSMLMRLVEKDLPTAALALSAMKIPGISPVALQKIGTDALYRARIAHAFPALPFSLCVLSRVVSEYDVRT